MHTATVLRIEPDPASAGYLVTIEFVSNDLPTKSIATYRSIDLNRLFNADTLAPLLARVWKEFRREVSKSGDVRSLIGKMIRL